MEQVNNQQYQQQQTMPAIGQAPAVQYQNQQQYPDNKQYGPQHVQQQPNNFQQNVPVPQNNASYLQNMANQAQQNQVSNGKMGVEDMDEPIMSFDDAFDPERKATLMRDFEIIKSMTLLDNDDYLYNLLYNSAAYVSLPFKMNSLGMFYRTKYQDLFDRYNSLHVFLEFVLSKVIYGSEAALKNACASRIIRLPNSSTHEGFKKMFGIRKRNAEKMMCSPEEIAENEIIKRSRNIKHPFLLHPEYLAQPILYNIGKCCDYVVPSEFAELFAHVQYETVSRMISSANRFGFKGLKVTLSRPIACILVSKTVATYNFTSLEYLSTLGDTLSLMTSLGKLDDTFSFGAKQSMQVELIKSNRLEPFKQSEKFDSGCHVAVVHVMQVCKLTNRTMSSKTYANIVYSVPEIMMTDEDMEKCNTFIQRVSFSVDESISKYEVELENIRKEAHALAKKAEESRKLTQENNNDAKVNGNDDTAIEKNDVVAQNGSVNQANGDEKAKAL